MILKIKLENGGKMPTKKTAGAACYDCYANLKRTVILLPFQTRIIPLGIRTEFDDGYYVEVRGRSGNAVKGIQIIHGTVDSDYRGIIGAITHNNSILPRLVRPNDRIAQICVMKTVESMVTETDSLTTTERGESGFGSTGK